MNYTFYPLFYSCFLVLATVVSAFAQNSMLSGVVKDEDSKPVAFATIQILSTNMGAVTDEEGLYIIREIPAGTYKVRASFVGYGSQTLDVIVGDALNSSQDFVLNADYLGLDEIIVTATPNDKTKLESSIAVTTLTPRTIEGIGPRSATDIFKAIPGFYTESSGGEGNGNVFARGLPNSGGLRYVQLQEDGLPVFEYGDLMFGNTDIWVRYDQNVEQVEGIRGGSASILTSNAPGGIINFISKTGGSSFGGSLKQTVGITYQHSRTDFDVGGPLGNNWGFHLGGHYRTDAGIRAPGYNANNGGQLRMNLTRNFKNGSITFYGKYLHDRTIGYLPIPLKNSPAEGIIGFNPNYGTLHSNDFLNLNVSTPFGGTVQEDLSVGMSPNALVYGGEATFDLGKGWRLKENFRNSHIKGEFNAIFGWGGTVWDADDYAINKGLTNYTYSYARGYNSGDSLDVSSLNGNGLVGEYGWWAVDIPLEQFANKIELSKSFGKLNAMVGYYYNQNRVSATWWWHTMLVDISGDPARDTYTRALNLVNNDTDESLTSNGFIQYGSLYRNYDGRNAISAPYLNLDYQATKALSINAALRLDMGNTAGFTENSAPFDYDVDGDGTVVAAERGVAYGTKDNISFNYNYTALSWTGGLNYQFSPKHAAFLRASRGNRAPQDRDYAFGATTSTKSGLPESAGIESIDQYELGYKLRTKNVSIFATAFYSYFGNLKFTDFVVDDNGVLNPVEETYNTGAAGLELEANLHVKNFGLSLSGTFQDARYQGWTYTDATGAVFDFDGNFVQRLPSLYLVLRPTYEFGKKAGIGLTLFYFGKRYTNPENKQILPSFTEINADAYYMITPSLRLGVNVANFTNTIGLTEGDPRTGLTSVNTDNFYARPILGRSATISAAYTF